MENKSVKILFIAQTLILLGGAVFAWSKLIAQFSNFQAIYGTIFRLDTYLN